MAISKQGIASFLRLNDTRQFACYINQTYGDDMSVPMTRFDHTSYELCKLARRYSNGYQTSRMLGIVDILDGKNRTQSAERNGMTGQTLRDWVHRYNAEGISGLKDRFRSGRTTKIPASVQDEMRKKLGTKPDPDKDGVVIPNGQNYDSF